MKYFLFTLLLLAGIAGSGQTKVGGGGAGNYSYSLWSCGNNTYLVKTNVPNINRYKTKIENDCLEKGDILTFVGSSGFKIKFVRPIETRPFQGWIAYEFLRSLNK